MLGGILVVGLLFVAGMVSFKLNPFKTESKDHSPPPILTELREMADLHAAQAEFEVVIDNEEDVRYIPRYSPASECSSSPSARSTRSSICRRCRPTPSTTTLTRTPSS